MSVLLSDQHAITDDLDVLFAVLPERVRESLIAMPDSAALLEVVLDLGREPEARFLNREESLDLDPITTADIELVLGHISAIGDDNRAGIERTLHRISVIHNRFGKPVGLTCRVGRAVSGTITIMRDLVESGQSILLLGKPGVGKTTMLREVARVLSDDLRKRVIIVDTSNEIAGDGDIPHPGIGRSRRMQVSTPSAQHAVMIEAVENHMPEVIIIDEIGTELEAAAARTIAERGVQLIGTAHGNSLDNLMANPTLSDLIGGIQTVTLGDDEARRRGTQKSVLERKAPPTFQVVVEIIDWQHVSVHANVADTIDAILRSQQTVIEVRERAADGSVHRTQLYSSNQRTLRTERQARFPTGQSRPAPSRRFADEFEHAPVAEERDDAIQLPERRVPLTPIKVYPFGVSTSKLEQAARGLQVPLELVRDLSSAQIMLTLRSYFRRFPDTMKEAEQHSIPVHVLRSNTLAQLQQVLLMLFGLSDDGDRQAIVQTEQAIERVLDRQEPVELPPANAYIRKMQHAMADRYNLASKSWGREPNRRVRISHGAGD